MRQIPPGRCGKVLETDVLVQQSFTATGEHLPVTAAPQRLKLVTRRADESVVETRMCIDGTTQRTRSTVVADQ